MSHHHADIDRYVTADEVQIMEDEAPVVGLARRLLNLKDEDWTFIDPEDVKRLARAVLERD